jgi:hypothetical protein
LLKQAGARILEVDRIISCTGVHENYIGQSSASYRLPRKKRPGAG